MARLSGAAGMSERPGFPPLYFRPVGRMIKLTERVDGMTRLCAAVRDALRSARWAPRLLAMAALLQQHSVKRVLVLVTIDDIPMPPAQDRVEL